MLVAVNGTGEQAKAEPGHGLGLYVHVPFCAATCDFCAFYQVKPTADAIRCFLEGVEAEANLVAWPRAPETIFWGGGTPGLLAPPALERLGAAIRARAGGAIREWTVELAPASVTPERLAVLRDLGVTRLSLGVQSFQPAYLEALGRIHSVEQIRRAHDRIRAAGWDNLNLDLMFALPGQTEAEWAADLREAVRLAPAHLSTYCLTFEEDTALWLRLAAGRTRRDAGREAALYERTWEWLGAAGYAQYEVSNFARPGRACIHNMNTWAMGEWVGLGPSAASQCGGFRGRNPSDLAAWRAGLARGERATEDRRRLTAELRAEDALIFGLRTNAGVDLAAWRARAPDAPWAAWDGCLARLAEAGHLGRDGDRVALTVRGRLLADAIAVELMAAG
jgi:oxygen-independent coproporphyrinogen-3 oxidase